MKKLLLMTVLLGIFCATPDFSYSQGKPVKVIKTKKDGTPDKRFKENKKLKKDGTPDKRFKEHKK